MNEYQANGLLTLPAGLVRIDEAQAKTRAHNLRGDVEGGVYEIAQPIQFKAGERFGWDGEVPKTQRELFRDMSVPVAVVQAAAAKAGETAKDAVKTATSKAKEAAKKFFGG